MEEGLLSHHITNEGFYGHAEARPTKNARTKMAGEGGYSAPSAPAGSSAGASSA